MYAETRTFVDEHPYVEADSRPRLSSRERLAGLGAERHLDDPLLAVALDRELDRLAGLVGADRHDQGDAVGDPSRRRPR